MPEADASRPNVPLIDKRGRLLTRLVVLRPGQPLSLEEQDFLEGLALQSAVAVERTAGARLTLFLFAILAVATLDNVLVIAYGLGLSTAVYLAGYRFWIWDSALLLWSARNYHAGS